MKKWIPFVLLGVFLFWMAPEIISHHLVEGAASSQVTVERRVLGVAMGKSVYSRDQVLAIGVRYHKAYFDFKMRGIYRVGLMLKDGSFVILKQLNTTLQYEVSLAYAPDLEIKHKQALEEARNIAARLNVAVKDETR